MQKKPITIFMIFILLFNILSCDGNLFVTPDVSEDVRPTMEMVKQHLNKETKIEIGNFVVRKLVKDILYDDEGKGLAELVTSEEMDELIAYLIPENLSIEIDPRSIPSISYETMRSLIILDKPQDIRIVNRILSLPLYDESSSEQSNAFIAVKALYNSVIIPLATDENGNRGLIQIGNALRIPTDDYHSLTYGDYLAVQMVISLILDTIPTAFINSYAHFEATSEETRMDEYFQKIGDNIVKALLVDPSVIEHILGTYTFLNKYNPSTTILDMKNLGSFFNVEEEGEI